MTADKQIHDRDCLHDQRDHVGGCFDSLTGCTIADIDRWTRHLWHTSQHNLMVIDLAGRIQEIVDEMRAAAGLPEFGWNTAFPDAEFGECSVHTEGCQGQETHFDVLRYLDVPSG